MTTFLGILGAAGLFALFGYMTIRKGSRLSQDGGECQSCSTDSCALHPGSSGAIEAKSPAGWWQEGKATFGDSR